MYSLRRYLLGLTVIGALLVGVLSATASAAPRAGPFDARFSDRECGEGKFCGTGTVTGFGRVKTVLALGAAAPPAPGCFGGKGTRRMTLESDPKSALRLAVSGAACGTRAWGTFKIVSGTGVFAGAKGSGIIWGSPTSPRYFGVISLTT